ncbi:MAG: RsmB/NOP family class I SAM-dependent RNA methyltransferase [Anaerohalosphaeraceae bacterium]|jgi:16S rRNA (cytosine967-C5)-methyltransferase
MKPLRTLTARAAAWKALNQCNIFKHDTAEVLGQLLSRTDRPAQATDIVFGVVRHRGTIDHILKKCSALESARVRPSQWNLLRMGVYELVYAPKTAEYAVLNEAVQLSRQASSKKGAGFINAVLRNIQRAIENRQSPLDAKHLQRTVPQTQEFGCLFTHDLLPDPEADAAAYFRAAFSLPQALVQEWLRAFGEEKTRGVCFASNRHPSIILQPNTLRTTAADLAEKLQEEGIFNEYLNGMIRIQATGKINTGLAYQDGLFFIQDVTAANAINTLAPAPDGTILDMCAAPGGKCMASAIHMQDKGLILASDAAAKRLSKVRGNAKRMRFQSIETVPASRLEQAVQKLKRLDAIILDVPCSNTGVLARRVEARWRWNPEAVKNLQKIQRELLLKAVSLARPQTKILYSTCSIQPEENAGQIQWCLSQNKSVTWLNEKQLFPSTRTPHAFDHDGGYVALLQCK